jgi:hypothetical protein
MSEPWAICLDSSATTFYYKRAESIPSAIQWNPSTNLESDSPPTLNIVHSSG